MITNYQKDSKILLIQFVHLIWEFIYFVYNYFYCKELKIRTTGEDIFKLVDENICKYNLKWENCVSVCTDGAPAMKGLKGFYSYVVTSNPNTNLIHWMIHREVLVSKSVPPILATVLDEVVKVVNYIKSNALRTRIFSGFCEAMDSEFKNLLYQWWQNPDPRVTIDPLGIFSDPLEIFFIS